MKTSIKNSEGLDLVIEYTIVNEAVGTAVVMHGLSGHMHQESIQKTKDVFLNNNYSTVIFDTTHSTGDSGGSFEDATVEQYYQDLVSVVSWVKEQPWFKRPFIISGHSLGGYSTLRYAEDYPEDVEAVIPQAPFISGEIYEESNRKSNKENFEKWLESGWRTKESPRNPGEIIRLNFPAFVEETKKHDLFKNIDMVTHPTLIIAGEKDWGIPLEKIKELFEKIPSSDKTLKVIPGAPHVWHTEEELNTLVKFIDEWLKSTKF